MDVLFKDPGVISGLIQAWLDSNPENPSARHEEGGYVVLNHDQSLTVQRWPRGDTSRISPTPLDRAGCYNGRAVVAAFHTHPHPAIDESGQEWDQEPSPSDRRWHQRRSLPGCVISWNLVYAIDREGNVSVLGKRPEVLAQ